MNKRMIVGVFAVAVAFTTLAFAQRAEGRREQRGEAPEHELELRHRQLELEAREAELDFERQMHELELEQRRAEFPRRHGREGKGRAGGGIFLAFCVVVNILLTVWVYQDIRKRNAGSGLWIAITLVAGFLGALLYALVRLGDPRQEGS